MKFTLAFLFAVFLTGISICSAAGKNQKPEKTPQVQPVVKNDDSRSTNANPIKRPAEDALDVPKNPSSELQSQIALMENIKSKAVAVNPANLILAVLETPEDRLVGALPTFRQLTQILEGTPLGMFLQNVETVVTDSDPYLWHSVIESFPEFVGSITEVGGKLAALANTEAEQLTVYEAMGLTNLFPIADVFSNAPLSQAERQSETEKIVSSNIGHAADLKRTDRKKKRKSKRATTEPIP